jgi:hypothetical protein
MASGSYINVGPTNQNSYQRLPADIGKQRTLICSQPLRQKQRVCTSRVSQIKRGRVRTHLEDSTLNRDFSFGGAGGVGVVGATACNDLSDVMRSTIFQVKNESVSVASSAPTVSTKRSARESGRRTGFIVFNPLPDRNRDREMQTRNGVLVALARPMLT